nr:hypothetical protein BdHM001_07140 [Bdellovibrio sp. HM001]BFD65875.1 hypothetical protein HAGR004_08970 [Bdellovibrio sp. HAGR004]
MIKPAQFAMYAVALSGLSLGILANPFGSSNKKIDPNEIATRIERAETYFQAGNYEGALEASKRIPPHVPRYADIRELRRKSEEALREYKRKIEAGEVEPRTVDRLPAALRDSYFDAKLEFSRGQCQEAYTSMAPVAKYLKNQQDVEIFKACLLTQRKTK